MIRQMMIGITALLAAGAAIATAEEIRPTGIYVLGETAHGQRSE